MTNIEITKIIYEAHKSGIWLWCEGKELKFKAPKSTDISEIIEKLRNNKARIIEILNENRVFENIKSQALILANDNKKSVLSFAQERLWFIEQFERGTNAYHLPMLLELDNGTDKEGISYALKQIVLRHEVLRSTLQKGDSGQGIQVIHNDPLSIEEVLVKGKEDLEALLKSDINRPFSLSTEYPIRVKLFRIPSTNSKSKESTERVILLVNIHHIASDGWSMNILQSELLAYYEAYFNQDRSFNLPALVIQYKDYALWQKEYLTGKELEKQTNYWKEKLLDYDTLALTTDYSRPAQVDYRGSHECFTINNEVSNKLRALAKANGTTMHSVLLSSLNILLGKYSGQEDIVIGSPNANRHYHQTAGLIGSFVNIQVNRTVLNATQSYAELIVAIHEEQVASQLHQDLPFEKLVDALGIDRDLSRHPIFQVMFEVYSNENTNKYLKPFDGSPLYEVEKFDLTVAIDESGVELNGAISYATSLFQKDTIVRLINHYMHLLAQLVDTPDKAYNQISLLNASEYEKVVKDWNATDEEYPVAKTIHQLFEAQTVQTPDRIALIYEGKKLTYHQLNEKSNQLARYIRKEYKKRKKEELKPDTLIPLFLGRNQEMVIGILGVLKAGAAYVPIDVAYPQSRIDYMLEDTKAELVLTQRHFIQSQGVELSADKAISIDLNEKFYDTEPKTNLSVHNTAKDLAYAIYTSGTTGKPKGVLIEHNNVYNIISSLKRPYGINDTDKILLFSSYNFDASVELLWLTLCNGAELFLLSEATRLDKVAFEEFLSENQITYFDSTPGFLRQIEPKVYPKLKGIILGGEACDWNLARQWSSKYRFYNTYGPTENTITSSINLVDPSHKIIGSSVPIGKPIANTQAYIINKNLEPQPIGVPGELYLGGAQLARGYLNQPELTKERFIDHPFIKGERLYRSGDWTRWLPDGNIEFLGRTDNQVKIRGFRIELGEIENQLTNHPEVKAVAVEVYEKNQEKKLVAYFVAQENTDSKDLQNYLLQKLPDYMIPAVMVKLDSIPLTSQGKLDKRALPTPELGSLSEDHVAPASETELTTCKIWEEVVGLDRVGITDDFFRIGGNSILAMQVSHRMSQVLDGEIKVADIFKHKTIAQLLAHSLGQDQVNIPKTDKNHAVLSFAQERLWFIEQFEEGTNAYHMPMVLELDGRTDKEAIIYALNEIVLRHEVLRSTIEKGDGEGIQVVGEDPVTIEEAHISQDKLEALIKSDIKRPFDLSTTYPIRVKFYKVQSTDTTSEETSERIVLLINIHHIASDGWSSAIFQSELRVYFEAYLKKDTGFSLPPLAIQYKDYALWQRSYLTGDVLANQINYWKEKLSGYEMLALPTDYARPNQVDYRGLREYFTINKATSDKLLVLAKAHRTTLHSLLLSCVNILFGKYTGQEDIVVGSPIANRHFHQTAGLVGFFVNAQVNRTLLSATQTYTELIEAVHQEQVASQFHQDLPFEKLVDELGIDRDLSRHPVFQVMFGVQSFGGVTDDHQRDYFKPFEGSVLGEVAKFDLSIFIDDGNEELKGSISYSTSLFRKSTITRLIAHFQHLLDQLVSTPDQAHSQISLLTPVEYEQVVVGWNATDKAYPKDKTIHELFEEQVAQTPDHIALIFEGEELTYQQLNQRSNQLARHIRTEYKQRTGQELKHDTLVGLYLDRSLEMVIGTLGVLKAGGAYVPIDPSYPQDRIDYLLEDTQSPLILTQRQLYESSNTVFPVNKVLPIDLTEHFYEKEEPTNLPSHSTATDLAYVIYTSGTTGSPKGVMVEHTSTVNFILDNIDRFELSEESRCLHTTSMTFDAGTGHLFRALLAGAKLFIMNKHLDALEVSRQLGITHLSLSAAVLNGSDNKEIPTLKILTTGGEPLHEKKVQHWMQKCKLFNSYGPTETTIGTLFNLYKPGDAATNIGKTINNTRLYVLNKWGHCVPIGIIGELHIGGASLTRGYLNNEALTTDRFVPNPFVTDEDKKRGYTKLYKTGDLVRWSENGNLEYVGRKDNQVKIRGYRVELGEVEHALTQIAGVKQGCVLAREWEAQASTKYLVGYYVPDVSVDSPTEEMILSNLSDVLPDYMVPMALVKLDNFPMTVNGKLDKKALPDPDFSAFDEKSAEPTNALENTLCDVYAEILGLPSDQISTHQNFFKIGGNSILSIKLKTRINELDEFKHIGIADLFKYNTINKLIKSIKKEESPVYKPQSNQTIGNNHEIAIIGMSGAFSGANNVSEFWQLIVNQQEGVKFHSKEECRKLDIDELLLENPQFIPVSGQVEGVELFDPLFWGISPNEARQIDPQIRKFMDHCWSVLESSGYTNQRKKKNIGVFGGIGASSYLTENILNGELADEVNRWEASMSNIKDALATKVAFHLGLTGPAYSINTACSTGLVSVVEACQKLRMGTCDMALAGGSSLSLPGEIGYIHQEGMTLSGDGHCRAFDKESTGTTVGSGTGVVLLKRLQDAISDGDNILSVIKGYATNNDGDRKTFYSAPSVIGQSECIIHAQQMSGVKSDKIAYVECHGTGTNLGDPIEVQALKEAFEYNQSCRNSSKHKTVLGSIKANVGHTDTAAGLAGLIKVCTMLQNNVIPGQVNYDEPNPELRLDQSNFEVLRENKAWLSTGTEQRLAGVSSFGIGGTNAHVIVGDYTPEVANKTKPEKGNLISKNGSDPGTQYVIPISAKSRQSLDKYRQELLNYLKQNSSLRIQDIAYSLQERREHFNHRSAYCAKSVGDLINTLGQDRTFEQLKSEEPNKIVFMFPGNGVQYTGMAKSLYDIDPFFKTTMDRCIQLANQHLDVDLYEVLYSEKQTPEHDIHSIQWAQVSLFVIEYALAKYLEHLGIKADAYIGHSFGEYVAATLAGVFALEDAIKVIISRGRLMQSMAPGSMLAINASYESIEQLVEECNCEISVVNSPDDIVASGYEVDIKKLEEKLERQEIPIIKINGSVAGHSKLMNEAAIEFKKTLSLVTLRKPTKKIVSNLTGEIATNEVAQPDYWSKHLRNKVQFSKGIETLCKAYNNKITFIELGPGKGLSYFINKYQNSQSNNTLKTLQLLPSSKEEANKHGENKENIISKLWMLNLIQKPNPSNLFKEGGLLTSLPGYQFNYQKCWLEKGYLEKDKKFNSIDDIFYERSWERKRPDSNSVDTECLKNKNVLVLINDQNAGHDGSRKLLGMLKEHCDKLDHVTHLQPSSIHSEVEFDLGKYAHITTILNNKTRFEALDLIIYLSPSIDLTNPALDILAIRNIFAWSKETNSKIPTFTSVSFDNYEVVGNEITQIKPSIAPGVTKSIPFEYFTSSIRAFHIDLFSQDINPTSLLQAITQKSDENLIAVRGPYHWIPTYQHIKISSNKSKIDGTVFLITGGLGAIGYAYAKHIAQRDDNCNIILIGRSVESDLRDDYKIRLANLRESKHRIIYTSMDIGQSDAAGKLEKLFTQHNIDKINLVLHTAGVVAKSAIYEKTHQDIKKVVSPKILGVENLIKLSDSIPITHLVSCSSLSSIVPSLGNMEYTAANLYLDEISFMNHPNIERMLAININHVSDAGAAIDFINKSTTKEERHANAITSHEFPNILDKILQENTRCMGISRYDIKSPRNPKDSDAQKEDSSNGNDIQVIDDNYTEVEFKTAQIFAQVLGIEQISLYDDFFTIGGNSILAIQVSHRMNRDLGNDVKISDLFKYKSIKEILKNRALKTNPENVKKVF